MMCIGVGQGIANHPRAPVIPGRVPSVRRHRRFLEGDAPCTPSSSRPTASRSPRGHDAARARLPGARRPRREDRAQGVDAGGATARPRVRQSRRAPPFRYLSPAAGRQLESRGARPTLEQQGDPCSPSAGRGRPTAWLTSTAPPRPWAVSRDEIWRISLGARRSIPDLQTSDPRGPTIGPIGCCRRAAIMNQGRCSAAPRPYSRAMISHLQGESFHPAAGLRPSNDEARPRHARAEADGAGPLNRWVWPSG